MESPFVELFYDLMEQAGYDPERIDWREVAPTTSLLPPPPPPPR
jgi:hypothetical protein